MQDIPLDGSALDDKKGMKEQLGKLLETAAAKCGVQAVSAVLDLDAESLEAHAAGGGSCDGCSCTACYCAEGCRCGLFSCRLLVRGCLCAPESFLCPLCVLLAAPMSVFLACLSSGC